jgi:tetratricopeptide (TPR) repeat protein
MLKPETSPEIDPLTRLAIMHGTDKWGPHFYTPVYHELFSKFRDHPVRLLEIGVGGYGIKTLGGGSLTMWADYFPNGQITGIDNAEKRLDLNPRVKVSRGSQEDLVFLQQICAERGPFDIVIDDGSHVPKHIVVSFNAIFPSLADGGIYVIEDVQTAFWPNFGGSILHGGDTLKLARTVIECLNHAEIAIVDQSHSFPLYAKEIRAFHAFHNLLVIEKGHNGEPSNFAYDLNNPYAGKAIKAIEQQLEGEPTADGLANLSNLYLCGGNLVRAREVADRALSLWPGNVAALMAAYTAAARQDDLPAAIGYLERFLKIEPDNVSFQQALEQIRAQRAKLAEAVPAIPQ